MKTISSIWSAMTGAERVVAFAAAFAMSSCVAFAAIAFATEPGDVSNPDVTFDAERSPGQKSSDTAKPPPDRTVDWTRFGYDPGRSKFLDAQRLRPPFDKVWKYKGDELIEFPPIVVDDRVYFIDNDGVYTALDAKTGKVIWEERLTSLNASSPAYYEGVLYSVSLEPGQALAVRARDGKVLWRRELGARAESSPMVVRDRMYFGDEAGGFYALDTEDGDLIWEASVEGSVKAAPALSEGVLYVGDYGGFMNAIRASDGEIVWQTADLGVGRIYSTAAVAFGRVYAGNVDDKVYSFDQENGEIAWTHSAGGYVYSGVAAADTGSTKPAVYVGSHDRNVYALDAESGDVIWQTGAGGQISGPATVIGDVVYVSTFSGNATIGLDLGTGRRVFSYDDGEYGPVVSDAETLYLTGGSTVTAFDPVDVGGFDYEPQKGQKGIVPPAELRAARKAMRGGGGQGSGGADSSGGDEKGNGRAGSGARRDPKGP
ncbi:MAG: PQQ-binding-like beta-propeller repeat protein [Actinomycetota bacterium]|nr:PQQ-binding-like beta-propeller repeat protein [Actinomycetota bacterium]